MQEQPVKPLSSGNVSPSSPPSSPSPSMERVQHYPSQLLKKPKPDYWLDEDKKRQVIESLNLPKWAHDKMPRPLNGEVLLYYWRRKNSFNFTHQVPYWNTGIYGHSNPRLRGTITKPIFDWLGNNFQVYESNGSVWFIGPHTPLDPVANPSLRVAGSRLNPWYRSMDRRSRINIEGWLARSKPGLPRRGLENWVLDDPWNILFYVNWFGHGHIRLSINEEATKFHRPDPRSALPPNFDKRKHKRDPWDFLSFNWYSLQPERKKELIDSWLAYKKTKDQQDYLASPWYKKLLASLPDFIRDFRSYLAPWALTLNHCFRVILFYFFKSVVFCMDIFLFLVKDCAKLNVFIDVIPFFAAPIKIPEITIYVYLTWYSFLLFPFGFFLLLLKRYVDGPNSHEWTLPRHRRHVISQLLLDSLEQPTEIATYYEDAELLYHKNVSYILGTASPDEFMKWHVNPYNLFSIFFRTRAQNKLMTQLLTVTSKLLDETLRWDYVFNSYLLMDEVMLIADDLYGPVMPKMRFRMFPLTWPINPITKTKIRRYEGFMYTGPGLYNRENKRGNPNPSSSLYSYEFRWTWALFIRFPFLYGVLYPLNWLGAPIVEFWLYFRYSYFNFWFPSLCKFSRSTPIWEKPLSSWLFSSTPWQLPYRLFLLFCHPFYILFFVYPTLIFEFDFHRFPAHMAERIFNYSYQYAEYFWLTFKRYVMGFYYGPARNYDRILTQNVKASYDHASAHLFRTTGTAEDRFYILPSLSFDDWLNLFKPRPWAYLDRLTNYPDSLFSLFSPKQFFNYVYLAPRGRTSSIPPVWDTLIFEKEGYSKTHFPPVPLYQVFRFTDPLYRSSPFFRKLFFKLELYDWGAYNWAKYHQLLMLTDIPVPSLAKYVDREDFDHYHRTLLRGKHAYWGNIAEFYWNDAEYSLLFPDRDLTVQEFRDEELVAPYIDPIFLVVALLSQFFSIFFLFFTIPFRFPLNFFDFWFKRRISKRLGRFSVYLWKTIRFPYTVFEWLVKADNRWEEAEIVYAYSETEEEGRYWVDQKTKDLGFPFRDYIFLVVDIYDYIRADITIRLINFFSPLLFSLYSTTLHRLLNHSGFGFIIVFFYIPWIILFRVPCLIFFNFFSILFVLFPFLFVVEDSSDAKEDWDILGGEQPDLEGRIFEFPDELDGFSYYDETHSSTVRGQARYIRPSRLHFKGRTGVPKAVIERELAKAVDELRKFAFGETVEFEGRQLNEFRTAKHSHVDLEFTAADWLSEFADRLTGLEDLNEEHSLEDEDEIDEFDDSWDNDVDHVVDIEDIWEDAHTEMDLPLEEEEMIFWNVLDHPVEIQTAYPFMYWSSTSSWGRLFDAAVYSYLSGSSSHYNAEMFRLRNKYYVANPKHAGWFFGFVTRLFRPLVWAEFKPAASASYLSKFWYYFKTFCFFFYNLLLAWVVKPCWYVSCFVVRWSFLLCLMFNVLSYSIELADVIIYHYSLQNAIYGDMVRCFPIWFFFVASLWVFSPRFRYLVHNELDFFFHMIFLVGLLFYCTFILSFPYAPLWYPPDYPFGQPPKDYVYPDDWVSALPTLEDDDPPYIT